MCLTNPKKGNTGLETGPDWPLGDLGDVMGPAH